MVKVRATDASQKYNKSLKEFHRVVVPGEEFEVTEERFHILNGNNKFHMKFVEQIYEEAKVIKPSLKENKVEIAQPVPEVVIEEPEIFIIEPGEDPVQVNEKLEPIAKPKTSKKKKSAPKEAPKEVVEDRCE